MALVPATSKACGAVILAAITSALTGLVRILNEFIMVSAEATRGHTVRHMDGAIPAGEKQPLPGYGMTAALNTPGKTLTHQCGVCYSVRCVNGPARGTPESLNPWGACLDSNKTVVRPHTLPMVSGAFQTLRWPFEPATP